MVSPKTKLTYEDYAKTPEDEKWELIDGVLIMAASPSREHQRVQTRLGTRLSVFIEARDLGYFYFDRDVRLSDTDTLRPDLIFLSKEREHIDTSTYIGDAPDLVVEIRSPSTAHRDLTVKRELYARYGVKEYWPVNPYAQTVTVLLLGDGDYEEVNTYRKGETLNSPTLEGFAVNLDEIFR